MSAAAGIIGRTAEADLRAGTAGYAACYTYSCSKGIKSTLFMTQHILCMLFFDLYVLLLQDIVGMCCISAFYINTIVNSQTIFI